MIQYTILIPSILFVIFGFLGLTCNNSHFSNIHTYVIFSGVFGMIDSVYNTQVIYIPMDILIGQLISSHVSECIKYKYKGSTKNRYKLPSILSHVLFNGLALTSILLGNYIFRTILYGSVLYFIPISTMLFHQRGTNNYASTRSILWRMILSNSIAIAGLSTIGIKASNPWFDFAIGYIPAYTFLSYTIYTCIQLTGLMRGKNLYRRMNIRGSKNIYVVHSLGRLPAKER